MGILNLKKERLMIFVEDSDPPTDMGFGLIHFLEKLVKKADHPPEIDKGGTPYVLKGNVNLIGKKLKDEDFENLPLFKVEGNFFIDGNKLTTLEGCPIEVHGSFSCTGNPLKNLIGLPKVIKGNTWIV